MGNPSIVIAPLTAADESLLAEMSYQAIFIPAGGKLPPRTILTEPGLRKYFAAFGTLVGDIGCKAVDHATGHAVGAAWVRLLQGDAKGYGYVNDDTPELSIAIDPAYRGQGIGQRLMTHLFTAVAPHFAAISLSVWLENPAYRLYQRLGFTLVTPVGAGPDVTIIKDLTHLAEMRPRGTDDR